MNRLNNAATSKFAAGGQAGGFNHDHASQMGHMAALRQQAARALSGRPTSPAPHQAGGLMGVPGGAVPGAAAPAVSYKQHITDHLAKHGVPATAAHVHAALDGMASAGHITPFQAGALKAHQGPLVGPQGAATQVAIMRHMLSQQGQK